MPRKPLLINTAILVELASVGSDTKTVIHPDTKFFLEVTLIENGIYARIHLLIKRGNVQHVLTFEKYNLTQSGSVITNVVCQLSDLHKQDDLSFLERYSRILCAAFAKAGQLYISTYDVANDKAFTLKIGEFYANTRYSNLTHVSSFFSTTRTCDPMPTI